MLAYKTVLWGAVGYQVPKRVLSLWRQVCFGETEIEKTGGNYMRTKFIFMTIIAASVAMAACGGSETNVNVRPANTTNANANHATPTVAPTIDRSNSNISREEYDKNRAEYEKDKGSSSIGQGVNDSWIWFKTRAALLTASDLRESTINVDVANDVITLKGTVANAAQKASAEKVAKGIDGQKGVKNELKVAPNDSMTNTKSSNSNTTSNSNTARLPAKK
jgi:BON domain